MICRRCLTGLIADRVSMIPEVVNGRPSGRYLCPNGHMPARLTDAGLELERPPLPKQPSPFREVKTPGPTVHGNYLVDERACELEECGVLFVPGSSAQKYHSPECAAAARYAREQGARPLRKCSWWECTTMVRPSRGGQFCSEACRQAKAAATLTAKNRHGRTLVKEAEHQRATVSAMLSIVGVGSPAGAGGAA